MSDQSPHSCPVIDRKKEWRAVLCFGALAVALAIVLGYSMASRGYQESLVAISAQHSEAIQSLDKRHSRILNSQIKNLREDLRQCLIQKPL